jgi:hypothetical protein
VDDLKRLDTPAGAQADLEFWAEGPAPGRAGLRLAKLVLMPAGAEGGQLPGA